MENLGQTIQLYLVDGTPSGLMIASIHGWTGTILVSNQANFSRLRARPESNRTGLYFLYGPDQASGQSQRMRAYIGEGDNVGKRIKQSADVRDYWETVITVTTSDDALTKGDIRYLEARLIEIAKAADRVIIENDQIPSPESRKLPEANQANMEGFLEKLRLILPVVGLDLLNPQPVLKSVPQEANQTQVEIIDAKFEVVHKSGVTALAVEQAGEFVVLAGSQALKDTNYVTNHYARLRQELIDAGILVVTDDGKLYHFTKAYPFKSPSAAGAIILNRNTNGPYSLAGGGYGRNI